MYSFSHFPVQLCNNLSARKGIKKPRNSEKRPDLFSLVFSEALSFELQSKNCGFFSSKMWKRNMRKEGLTLFDILLRKAARNLER